MPKDDGYVWFTVDCLFSSSQELNNVRLNRHLLVDLNEPTQLNKIKNLADKVVVDVSVLKFFNKPWDQMGELLFDKNSVLITERDAVSGIGCSGEHVIYTADTGQMQFPLNYLRLDKSNRELFYITHKKILLCKIKAYLKTIFSNVTFTNGDFPYKHNYEHNKRDGFFTLTNFKRLH